MVIVLLTVANNLGFLSGKYKHVGFIVLVNAWSICKVTAVCPSLDGLFPR